MLLCAHLMLRALPKVCRASITLSLAAHLYPVIKWAKKTGDYSVLSQADLCVIALTYALQQEEKKKAEAKVHLAIL